MIIKLANASRMLGDRDLVVESRISELVGCVSDSVTHRLTF